MPDAFMGVVWAFGWGMAAASGVLVGAILGLMTRLPHRAIAAMMSLGAGLMLSAASVKVATEALVVAGVASTVAGIVLGGAIFSIANAALVGARDRKRCGECKPQPSESDAPGSGGAIAVGSATTTALAFHFLADLGPDATAMLKAYGAGALIAVAAETMIPEAFHNGPRFSGVLAAAGFAALILLADIAR